MTLVSLGSLQRICIERKLRLSRANYIFCRFPTTGLLLSFSIDFPSARIFIIITPPRRSYKPLCWLCCLNVAITRGTKVITRSTPRLTVIISSSRFTWRCKPRRIFRSKVIEFRLWHSLIVRFFFLSRLCLLSFASFFWKISRIQPGERVVSDDNVKSRPPRNAFVINFCFERILESRPSFLEVWYNVKHADCVLLY